ncbi:hypothetical protein NLM33_26195 [Bradyrhizobium sp. CCGUVB1N3]|uniref:hypothetical protein n=1 Tax=Bradyrhizobium sp. CCGUVB1N3 TaxID=2949629 RepID=UPI0020B1EB24|nr:hypothetical protein [Bradyrhizobium sp. CCGUVB1N3]MCP3473810.1 hypothetical protein [Bradyrhizobium sp. CCGUVB1N3]
MNADVTPASSCCRQHLTVVGIRMSVAEYDAERANSRTLVGSSVEVTTKRDQAIAQLFHRSGWTQLELAQKEGKSDGWVNQRLRFGGFLNFLTQNLQSIPASLTERRFRGLWEQTNKDAANEEYRFQDVLKLLDAAREVRPRIAPDIVKQFGDGKWHEADAIAKALNTDVDHVDGAMRMMTKYGTHGAKAEKRSYGTSHRYRIFKQDRAIGSAELLEKLTPIIKGLEAEGRSSAAAASPAAVRILAGKLRKLLDEWT